MAGLSRHDPVPTDLVVHQKSRILEIRFDDGRHFRLPFELLRVYSPSAEVRGHGPGQETLQVGKRDVGVVSVESVGHYAIRPTFDDGHDSGIYSWDYLHWLGDRQSSLWADYLARLEAAGASRDPAGASRDPDGAASREQGGDVTREPDGAPTAAAPMQSRDLSRPR